MRIKVKDNHYYGLDLLRGISGYGVAICHFYAFIYANEILEYLSFIFVEFFCSKWICIISIISKNFR